MKKWSLNSKIYLIMSIFILGSIVIALSGIRGMMSLNDALNDIVNKNAARVDYAHEIKSNFNLVVLNEKNYILADTSEERADYKKTMDEYEAKMETIIADYSKIATESGKKDIQDFKDIYSEWKRVDLKVLALADQNKDMEAFGLSSGEGKDARYKGTEITDGMVSRNQKVMAEEMANANSVYKEMKFTMILTSLIAIVAGLIFAYFVMRTVNRAIDQVINNLTDSSGQVTSAAHQIAATSEELSGAVTEQASSLEETAASVEELNSMVQKNAENAHKTSTLSGSSRDSATKGKSVVQEMVTAIDDINESNNSIMESINESNRQISQIVDVITEIGTKTKVINDIVFQTKLLSFNASVEAARAGEHGKGFSVVAEEIGNLAKMSGDSAKEITMMLDESILKVQTIVSETKTRVEGLIKTGKMKVEAGTKVARDCDVVLDEIVYNVASVTSMAQEISNACQEQALGVQEITKAIGQLDQVTQNNSATSEEAASAANELSAQAESLRSVIGVLVHTIKGYDETKMALTNNVVAMAPKRKPIAVPVTNYKKVSGDSLSVPQSSDSRFEDI